MYHLRVYGPNGFFREFKGSAHDPLIDIAAITRSYGKDQMKLQAISVWYFTTYGQELLTVVITDNAYKTGPIKKTLNTTAEQSGNIIVPIDLSNNLDGMILQ